LLFVVEWKKLLEIGLPSSVFQTLCDLEGFATGYPNSIKNSPHLTLNVDIDFLGLMARTVKLYCQSLANDKLYCRE